MGERNTATWSESTTSNQVLDHLLCTIRGLLQELIRKSQELAGARELAQTRHEEIVQALKEHNTRKARSAICRHLHVFQRRYNILLKAADSQPRELSSVGTVAFRPRTAQS